MANKRSSAARKTAGVKVRITGKQRKARQLNIEVARQHRKKAGGTKKMIRKGVNAPKAPLTRTQRKKKGLPTNAKEMAKIKRKSVGKSNSIYKVSRKELEKYYKKKIPLKSMPAHVRDYWEKTGRKGSFIR